MYRCCGHDAPGCRQYVGLEMIEAPLEERRSLPESIGAMEYYGDEAPAVPGGRSYEAMPCRHGVAGFDAVCPGKALEPFDGMVLQQDIPRVHGSPDAVRARGHGLLERWVPESVPCHDGEIASRRAVGRFVQTIGIAEDGVHGTYLPGLSGHHLSETLLGPGNGLCCGNASVVRTAEDEAVEKIPCGHLLAWAQMQRTPFRLRASLAGRDYILGLCVLKEQDGGHNLGSAGRWPGRVCVLGVKNLAAHGIYQNSRCGAYGRGRRDGWCLGHGERCGQEDACQEQQWSYRTISLDNCQGSSTGCRIAALRRRKWSIVPVSSWRSN